MNTTTTKKTEKSGSNKPVAGFLLAKVFRPSGLNHCPSIK